jgi:hypothetical protein
MPGDPPTPIRTDLGPNPLEDHERKAAEQLLATLVAQGIGGERPWEPFLVRAKRDAHGVERGIWLQAHTIPPYVALVLERRRDEPTPPEITIRDTEGGIKRVEPNPNDPAYQAAHRTWEIELQVDQQKAILTTAIEVLYADEGWDLPDDPTWAETITLAGIPVAPPGTKQRQVDYLLYYALASTQDLGKTVHRGLLMVGTPEVEVGKAAATNFPDLPGRRTDQPRPTAAG